MAKTNISDYRFSIFINNDQAKRSLVEMENVMRGYESELARLVKEKKKDTEEYRQAKKVYDDHLIQMEKVRKEAGLQALSLKELKGLRASLNNEMGRAIPGTEHRAKLQKEFDAVNNRILALTNGAKTSSLTFGKMAEGFNKYFGIITAGAAAFTGMIFTIKNMISTQAELADSLANIQRTTGMTANEVNKLNQALRQLDTRTSVKDLREMAVVAGQLGIDKGQVLDFVSSVDKLNVALGSEIKGGAEEVAKQVGTLRNVLTDMKSANLSDDLLRIGNAVNALGMAGFATAPVVIDFANRIGGVGLSLGLTSDEVLGLSATLQELNVNTERGGTAISKILQKMTTNLSEFAAIAGIPVQEFTDLVNKDLFGAFMKVLEGTKRGGQSATLLAGIIKDLEVQGAGASEVFAKLGSNTAMLAEKVQLAGGSLQGTDSIMDAFQKKNENLAGDLEKLRKSFYALITLPDVNNFFRGIVYEVIALVNWFKDLPLFIEKYKIALIAVTGATVAWIAAKTRSLQVAILNNLTLKEGILLKIKDSVTLSLLIAKEELLTIWKAKGTVATKLAATAQYAWNAAISANPIGAVILGVTALVAAIKAYDKYNAEAVRNEKIKESTLNRMTVVNGALKKQYEQLNDQIRNLNTLSQQEKIDLEEKIAKNIRLAETELLLMQARQKDIGDRNTQATVWQTFWNTLKAGGNAGVAAIYDANDALNNGKAAADQMNDGISALQENLKNLKSTQNQLFEITRAESLADNIHGKTMEQLTEKLNKYQTALRNTIAGSEDYVRIQNKIKETNKELAKFNASAEEDKKKKEITSYQKLNQQISEYLELLRQQITDDPEQAKITAQKIKRLELEKKKIDDLIKSYTEADNIQMLKGKGFPSSGSLLPDKIGKSDTIMIDGVAVRNDYKGSSYEDTGNDSSFLPGWNEATFDEKISMVADYASAVVNTFSQLDQALSSMENAQLARDQQINEQKKLNLKRQLDAKRITQQQYNIQVEKLDADLAKKQRKIAHDQAVRQKELAIIQTTINTLAGASRAWVDPGGVAGIVLAVLIGVLGAIQIGLIASTPVPQALRGRYKAAQAAMGRYDVIGQEDGRLYKDVPYQSSMTGIPGRPMLVNETGNEIVIDPHTTRNIQMNYPQIIDAINYARVPQRASGQYSSSSGGTAPIIVAMDPKYLAGLERFNENTERLIQEGLQAQMSYDEFIRVDDKVSRINQDASRE